MKNIDFKLQSTTIAPPTTAGYVKIYANASGALEYVNYAGTTGNALGLVAQNISQAGGTITTGTFIQGHVTAAGTPFTGSYFGNTGAYGSRPVFLSGPAAWLPVTGPSGELYVLPAYLRAT